MAGFRRSERTMQFQATTHAERAKSLALEKGSRKGYDYTAIGFEKLVSKSPFFHKLPRASARGSLFRAAMWAGPTVARIGVTGIRAEFACATPATPESRPRLPNGVPLLAIFFPGARPRTLLRRRFPCPNYPCPYIMEPTAPPAVPKRKLKAR